MHLVPSLPVLPVRAPYPVWDVEAARLLSRFAHSGQVDKIGDPYWKHPDAVARLLTTHEDYWAMLPAERDITYAAALLHDCEEDTRLTGSVMLGLGVPFDVVEIVQVLTHEPGEPRAAYYARIRGMFKARLIKRCDVAHNSHPSRLSRITDPATRTRLIAKYAEANMALR